MTKAATKLSQIKVNECVSYKTSLWYVNFHSNIRKTTEVQRGQRVGAWIAGESVTKLLNYLMGQEEQCWKWYMIRSSSYDIWTWTTKRMLNRIAAKKTQNNSHKNDHRTESKPLWLCLNKKCASWPWQTWYLKQGGHSETTFIQGSCMKEHKTWTPEHAKCKIAFYYFSYLWFSHGESQR